MDNPLQIEADILMKECSGCSDKMSGISHGHMNITQTMKESNPDEHSLQKYNYQHLIGLETMWGLDVLSRGVK